MPDVYSGGVAFTVEVTPIPELGSVKGKVEGELLGLRIGLWLATVEVNNSPIQTGFDGSYEVKALPPQTYKITASHFLFKSESKDVEIKAGETAEVNFLLKPFWS